MEVFSGLVTVLGCVVNVGPDEDAHNIAISIDTSLL